MYNPFLPTRLHSLRSSPNSLSINEASIGAGRYMRWSVKEPACRLKRRGQRAEAGVANLLERHQGGKRYRPIRIEVGLKTLRHREGR